MRKMKWGKQQFNIFAITLSPNEHDLLEIYPSNVLTQKHYRKSDLVVVGIAYGKEEAMDMMQLVLQDCMEATGDLDVKSYIRNNMQ
jgi:hypothetical protein